MTAASTAAPAGMSASLSLPTSLSVPTSLSLPASLSLHTSLLTVLVWCPAADGAQLLTSKSSCLTAPAAACVLYSMTLAGAGGYSELHESRSHPRRHQQHQRSATNEGHSSNHTRPYDRVPA